MSRRRRPRVNRSSFERCQQRLEASQRSEYYSPSQRQSVAHAENHRRAAREDRSHRAVYRSEMPMRRRPSSWAALRKKPSLAESVGGAHTNAISHHSFVRHTDDMMSIGCNVRSIMPSRPQTVLALWHACCCPVSRLSLSSPKLSRSQACIPFLDHVSAALPNAGKTTTKICKSCHLSGGAAERSVYMIRYYCTAPEQHSCGCDVPTLPFLLSNTCTLTTKQRQPPHQPPRPLLHASRLPLRAAATFLSGTKASERVQKV